jgi:hypothetical protein
MKVVKRITSIRPKANLTASREARALSVHEIWQPVARSQPGKPMFIEHTA